jgi:phenylalanyl-tRNA synthetase beta chain
MQISLNWINEFVNIKDIDIQDIANDFTMKTAEVEAVKSLDEHLERVTVVEIKSLRKHPEADKLNLVTFETGSGLKEVVCGAPNVAVGLKVPYASLGTTLPGGFFLEAKVIRGVKSEGMLCSAKELGLGEGTQGLLELPNTAKVGQTLAAHLGATSDVIIEVDNKSLTHRPDLWGLYGIAREFSAIYGRPLTDTFSKEWRTKIESHFNKDKAPLTPIIHPTSAGKVFWGLSIDGVTISESPQWLKNKLTSVGLKPINNIVDVSNYVMFELGLPLHIYDREKIKNKIEVVALATPASFETLDGVTRDLIPGDTVIRDEEKILVLAGIMGGQSSGVSDQTKKIFIEVANWDASSVRKTSSRLGLRSESSSRYEKSLDSALTYRTLLRTVDLILQFCPSAKVIGSPQKAGEDQKAALQISTSLTKINSVLGANLSFAKVKGIFESLDFKMQGSEQKFTLEVPSYRSTKDISIEEDLIEEIGRIVGYGEIPVLSPQVTLAPVNLSSIKAFERKTQDFFSSSARSLEVMGYPLVGPELLTKAQWSDMNDKLVLVNALSVEADRMRPSLIPGLLQTATLNAKHHSEFSFFELGRVYTPEAQKFSQEKRQVAFVMYSKESNKFLNLLNHFENYLNCVNVPFSFEARSEKFANPIVPADWLGLLLGEFDPGSERTLAACLIHASRT